MNNSPAITYELALLKLEDLARAENLAGTGHRTSARATSIRVLVGAYLVAIGRWIGGPTVIVPAAGSR